MKPPSHIPHQQINAVHQRTSTSTRFKRYNKVSCRIESGMARTSEVMI